MHRLLWALPALAVAAMLAPAQKPPAGGQYALLVGCQDYDEKHLRKLACPRADVTDFAKVLEESGYPKDHVVLMHDGPGQDRNLLPEADKVREQLRLLLKGLDEGDSVVVALAGHGVQFKGSDRQYFCPVNADPARPDTLLPLDEVFDALKGCKAGRKLLLVDACRNDPQSALARDSGGPPVESVTRPPPREAVPKGLLALFSCDAGQRSFEHPELGHGIFFHQVIQSWKGPGGEPVTLEAFRRAVRQGTRDYARLKFRELQTPVERGEVVNPDEWVLNPRVELARPPLLDCTGPSGKSKAEVEAAQQTWAKYLKRPVNESVDVGGGVKMEFVLVPPGRFLMGSPKEEQDYLTKTYFGGKRPTWLDGEKQFEVELTQPFYLGRYAVTQEQYMAITSKANPSEFSAAGPDKYSRDRVAGLDTRRFPVENVSWQDAKDCADDLEKKRGDGLEYRLPTEAEWEYSCRGGYSSSLPFGIGDGRSLSPTQANFNGEYPFGGTAKGEYRQRPCPVGQLPGNSLGLYDMHGNVWQWCADWYGDYPVGKAIDPTGPLGGSDRVRRGGGWDDVGQVCRSAYRSGFSPDIRYSRLGFRLAHSVPSAGK
jgi:formylglycine-generating enzyme required for sulfatase activity